jgi:hypothetical protein
MGIVLEDLLVEELLTTAEWFELLTRLCVLKVRLLPTRRQEKITVVFILNTGLAVIHWFNVGENRFIF